MQYDGTAFCGMQYQGTVRTVAGELERALSQLLQHEVKISSAGRTDSGVHACGQVVSWKTQTAFPFERFALAANAALPRDVGIRSVEVVDDDFSARFSAVERTYVYVICCARERWPLLERYAHHVWLPLDIARIRSAAAQLIGEHDFRAFCGSIVESGPTTRTVRALEVRQHRNLIRIEIRADGFLHRMVRTIVGTLLECGYGRRDPASIAAILQAGNRAGAGLTAPARGLYLAGVRYADGFDSFAEPPVSAAFGSA